MGGGNGRGLGCGGVVGDGDSDGVDRSGEGDHGGTAGLAGVAGLVEETYLRKTSLVN